METTKALQLAEEQEMDVVVVTEKANPPVAKIVDFNKFLYSERKKQSEVKNKGKQSELKELRISANISDGDIRQRAKRAAEFLEEGNIVKISLTMKGRQTMYPQIAEEKLRQFIKLMEPVARLEGEPKKNGSTLSVIFVKK